MKTVTLLFFFLLLIFGQAFASSIEVERTVVWRASAEIRFPDRSLHFSFDRAIYNPTTPGVPFYFESLPLNDLTSSAKGTLIEQRYLAVNEKEMALLKAHDALFNEPQVTVQIGYERKKSVAQIRVFPFRKTASGQYEKLAQFRVRIDTEAAGKQRLSGTGLFATGSILKKGTWFKIAVDRDGIYKLSYTALQQMGLDTLVNPIDIRLFGNGGGMVPDLNSLDRADDLIENAIEVKDENFNGRFDTTDYILFYGEGPDRWVSTGTNGVFKHVKHLYSDSTFYFITVDQGPGKRLAASSVSASANVNSNSFNDRVFHEEDKYNFVKSGSEWYGESFEIQTSQTIPFSFPNLVTGSPVTIVADVLARSSSSSTFTFRANGVPVMDLTCPSANIEQYWSDYAMPNQASPGATFLANTPSIAIGVDFNKPTSSAAGWLNYIELNARRQLTMSSSQLTFRDASVVGAGNTCEYSLGVNTTQTRVWDVTQKGNASALTLTFDNGQARFKADASTLHEFVAFTNTGYLTPRPVGKIANQDLHGLELADMLIVAHPKFLTEAERLADFHRSHDGLTVHVVTPEQVYNEFASGAQDASAIRDFVRMMYERSSSSGTLPKYLLLFGDGSYDNKHRLSVNTNYIVTCQSKNSLSPTGSYVCDDYFVQLDPNEGNSESGGADLPDVAIGRLPVKTVEEAKTLVDKIIQYNRTGGAADLAACSNGTGSTSPLGDWRNTVCFVADDGDSNTHLNDANSIATFVDTTYKNYNIDKIYLDAYRMQSTPGGQRYPDVNDAIDRRMSKGALILNYTGHGGEAGWAHERILDFNMINSWTNANRMPLFFTATCEFSRFDDPALTSAGEQVLLSPSGGAMALMTTTRLVYSSPNKILNDNFFKIVFEPDADGKPLPIGEIFRRTKVNSGALTNNRNFTLLGDPAVTLTYPKHRVVTTAIQGHPISSVEDTLKALSKVTIQGEIRDKAGNKLSDFQGLVYPTVYDKADSIQTLGNKSDESIVTRFKLRKNIIYRGKASVKNGAFSFTFIVPKDIAPQFGDGRISYYAQDGSVDAAGFFEDVQIGGRNADAASDNAGPKVKLYMNDERFARGGITDENPKLFAILSDENGVNTVGNGIGHDLTAILDNKSDEIIALNDYYEADLDSYQSGRITYPFSKLSAGSHQLRLKVWDVYNNSSDAETEFIVAPSAEFALSHVLNYPNPFTTRTLFYFEHNRPCVPMNVQIQIFTISGKLVTTLEKRLISEGYHPDPIEWDGKDGFGNKIGRGVYVYRLRVQTVDGKYADKLEKLVILN